MLRYLKVYKKQLIVLFVIIALVCLSTYLHSKKASSITAVAAGIVMIGVAIFFLIWIIKTPTKKDNNQIV